MKMTNGNKGQMRVVETILASFVIVAALAFANAFAITPPSPRYETSDLERLGYNVLHNLDEQGLLTRFVYDRDWSSLQAALRVSLPVDVCFNLTVYSVTVDGDVENQGVPIVYGESDIFASSGLAASVTYVLSGSGVDYDPRILVLQLVRG